ncbi:IS3 family transposase [Nocardia sp. NBC_01377]|uniref:IS3 family transposase n=1 Tax=Nocardia sp. NBC_01377 TaxID=2903595 RepID=UPI003247F838
MTDAYDDLRAVEVPIRRACTLIGRSRATHYRHQRPPIQGPEPARAVPDNGQALTAAERAHVLTVINSPPYADLAICQIWARELDEGNYWCSMSSMYRIAAAAGQNRERRRQATHAARVKPELLADGPSQVWTWDITKLRGPAKGVWFHLYVLIDIYSRYTPSWIVSRHESAELAQEFIDEAIARNGDVPHTVHADRGPSMTSGLVSELLTDLGVTRSHSRPRTSNDNPFSEAQFKTLKYLHDFPKSFASLKDARLFLEGFFNEYNHIHRHSGIGWHTPASVHFGTADTIDDARQITLTAAYHANPARFGHRPTPPKMPAIFYINEPAPEPQIN